MLGPKLGLRHAWVQGLGLRVGFLNLLDTSRSGLEAPNGGYMIYGLKHLGR